MAVTDLVRDTCKTATRLVESGNSITVKSGDRILFRIVPNQAQEVKLTAREYKSLLEDLDEIAAKANLDENPIVKMRKVILN